MNYFALAGGVISAVLALVFLLVIVRCSLGNGRWADPFWGPILNSVLIGAFATAAAAFFRMAVAG
jgi:hypothetical protein